MNFLMYYITIIISKNFLLKNVFGLARYIPLLPVIDYKKVLSQYSFNTPVIKTNNFGKKLGYNNVWVKYEDLNPNGCFKDRESLVIILKAIEKKINSIHIVSSGNAALSIASFANKFNIKCTCFIPSKTTQEKQDLIKFFGAKLIKIPGFYEDVYRRVVNSTHNSWNVTAGQNVFRGEGDKTIAFELWEQIGVPDYILVPCGNGTNLAGIFKGFWELKQLKKINKLPKMIGVQIKKADPLKKAIASGNDYSIIKEIEDSIAEGIVAEESYDSPKAIKAIKDSNGYIISVTDEEIKKALKLIIKLESIIPEITSASAYAALAKLKVSKCSKIIIINTGSGMKTIGEINAIVSGD